MEVHYFNSLVDLNKFLEEYKEGVQYEFKIVVDSVGAHNYHHYYVIEYRGKSERFEK